MKSLTVMFAIAAVTILSSGCRTPGSAPQSAVLESEDGIGAAGPCDDRAKGAALAIHRQHYDLESVNFDQMKFLGIQEVGTSQYATYFVLNTDETDAAGWLLSFPMKEDGRCGWIPFLAENDQQPDQRLYQLLPY